MDVHTSFQLQRPDDASVCSGLKALSLQMFMGMKDSASPHKHFDASQHAAENATEKALCEVLCEVMESHHFTQQMTIFTSAALLGAWAHACQNDQYDSSAALWVCASL